MLLFNYGDWTFWGAYNPPTYLGDQKVTFDGDNKLILVNEGVTSLDFKEDVYSAWKEWLLDPNHQVLSYEQAIAVIGGEPLPGNRQVGTTFFLENGWRMRTWEGDHELTVTGNVFTREGAEVFVETLEPWTITINLNTSTLVETILPQIVLSTADIDAVSAAVWDEVISGTTAAARLIALQTSIDGINITADDVWNYIIDNTKNQSAKEKLKAIATKTQDIALS